VDLDKAPGKTFVDFTDNGKVTMLTDIVRQAFLSLLISDLEKLNHIKLDI
jgi:hypothetical protein